MSNEHDTLVCGVIKNNNTTGLTTFTDSFSLETGLFSFYSDFEQQQTALKLIEPIVTAYIDKEIYLALLTHESNPNKIINLKSAIEQCDIIIGS